VAVYGYTRITAGRQAEGDKSLGAQQRKIDGYAMRQRLTLDGLFIERGVSGSVKLSERPEGGKLVGMLQHGDVIITPKLDRMFRSALDALDTLAKLQARGVSLHMIDLGGDVTGPGISKLVFTILSAVAEAERDRIRERIQEVKSDERKRNRYLGGSIPFGWKMGDGSELIPDPSQQAAIATIRRQRAAGDSLRTIAEAMNAKGFAISHSGVKNVLDAKRPVPSSDTSSLLRATAKARVVAA
jgi:putative DNA-invertase from lambdoid prophage Rac